MKVASVILFVLCPTLCIGAGRFFLQSELRTNYTEGGSNKAFTKYAYDESGNRIVKRVYDGIDSTAALMSREKLSYDDSLRLTEDLLLSSSGDTLTIVRNNYGTSGLVRAATLNKNGSVRFVDSLFHSNGLLTEQRRYNATGAVTFFHRCFYTSGLQSADSLFEPDGAGGFEATQALLTGRSNDSTVSKETQWRKSGTSWYPVGTTKMTYDKQKHLLCASTYETDGSSGRLTDSLFYAYDSNGNRVKESDYDADRALSYDIVYTWFDTQPSGVFVSARQVALIQKVTFRSGRIDFGAPVSGTLAIYTANGREAGRYQIGNGKYAPVGNAFAPGRYFAMINGNSRQILSFTINN